MNKRICAGLLAIIALFCSCGNNIEQKAVSSDVDKVENSINMEGILEQGTLEGDSDTAVSALISEPIVDADYPALDKQVVFDTVKSALQQASSTLLTGSYYRLIREWADGKSVVCYTSAQDCNYAIASFMFEDEQDGFYRANVVPMSDYMISSDFYAFNLSSMQSTLSPDVSFSCPWAPISYFCEQPLNSLLMSNATYVRCLGHDCYRYQFAYVYNEVSEQLTVLIDIQSGELVGFELPADDYKPASIVYFDYSEYEVDDFTNAKSIGEDLVLQNGDSLAFLYNFSFERFANAVSDIVPDPDSFIADIVMTLSPYQDSFIYGDVYTAEKRIVNGQTYYTIVIYNESESVQGIITVFENDSFNAVQNYLDANADSQLFESCSISDALGTILHCYPIVLSKSRFNSWRFDADAVLQEHPEYTDKNAVAMVSTQGISKDAIIIK